MADRLNKPVENRSESAQTLYDKSIEVIVSSQISTGGTAASLKGSRYAGHVYPRDHAYTTRAFVAAGKHAEAKQALVYILNTELSEDGVMYQRYDQNQQSTSNKPPQIDGNAQTLIALADYMKATRDGELVERYKDRITQLEKGLQHHTHEFSQGHLVYSINGIIEFSPFEEGFEIYTNACAVAAYRALAYLYSEVFNDSFHAEQYQLRADSIRKGIKAYLYIPEYKGFVACVRTEPNPSVVTIANLKSFLALIDFDIFDVNSKEIQESLSVHMEGTWNPEIGAYNRYGEAIGRHNFGNGPWPMVMLRLAEAQVKAGNKEEARKAFDWVLNVALLNEEVPMGLPEHVVTKEELLKEFHGFMRTFDINPREERKNEYEKNEKSTMLKKHDIAYPINPLIWSHAQYVLVWKNMQQLLK